jgi:YesN/AraC family two-component response regulator
MLEKMRMENLDAYVVILSAFQDFAYAQKAIELGVSNYIVKSTKYDELVRVFQKIHDNLDNGQSGVELHACQAPAEMSGEVLDKIKRYISDHIAAATLQSTADYVKYSPIYLSRLFKEKAGINFINYICSGKNAPRV